MAAIWCLVFCCLPWANLIKGTRVLKRLNFDKLTLQIHIYSKILFGRHMYVHMVFYRKMNKGLHQPLIQKSKKYLKKPATKEWISFYFLKPSQVIWRSQKITLKLVLAGNLQFNALQKECNLQKTLKCHSILRNYEKNFMSYEKRESE